MAEQDRDLPLDLLRNDDVGDGLAGVRFDVLPLASEGSLTVLDGGIRRPVLAGEVLSATLMETLVFSPASGFSGAVSQVTYAVIDGTGDESSANLTVYVDPAPIAQGDVSAPTANGSPVTIDVLANDQTGDVIVFASLRLEGTTAPGQSLVVAGEGIWSVDTAAGTVTFTPEAGFVGDPTPVSYTVQDDEGYRSTPATIYADYVPLASADVSAPATPGQPVTVDVLGNDAAGDAVDPATVQLGGTAAPGDPLVVTGEGTWSINPATGAITFTPEAGFVADPTPVTYTVSDANGNTTYPTTLDIDVVPVGAADVSSPAATGAAAVIDVLGNDILGDTVDPATVQITGTANPGDPLVVAGEGTWSVNPTTGVITFTPEAGFVVDPTPVTYVVSDTDGNVSAPIAVAADYVPVAASDVSLPSAPGSTVTVDVLANDVLGDTVDPTSVQVTGTANAGDPLVIAGEGTWTVNPVTGAISFTPEPGFYDDPTPVSYSVSDDQGNDTAANSVTVDYEPTAVADTVAGVLPGDAVTIDVLGNDLLGDAVDPATVRIIGTANPGDPLVVTGEGVWTVNPTTGAITFTPAFGFTLDPTPISYVVADAEGNISDPVQVSIDYLTIVENTEGNADPNAGDAFEFEDDGEAELSVEPIVRETADNAAPLHSITPLDAEFPILGAVNSLMSLQGVTALPTEGVAFFAGLAAQYPITLAVKGVNPEALFNDLSMVQRDSFDVLRGFSDVIGETISGYLLVGKDRVIILLSDLNSARSGEINALIGATEKAGSPLVAVITGQNVRTVKGDTLAVLKEDPEGTALYLETAGSNGVIVDVATSEDGQVRFEATENQNIINFTGQVAGIVDARQHEMDALAASLQIV